MSRSDFTPDQKLAAYHSELSEKCVRYFRGQFGQEANYSDAFIERVEDALDLLWLKLPEAKPSQKDVEDFAVMFGSYLGETYRRNHGGEWGGTSEKIVAMRTRSGLICFPSGRVLKRLTNGPEDEICSWYQYLVREGGGYKGALPPPLPSSPPPLPSASSVPGSAVPVLPVKQAIKLMVTGFEGKYALAFFVRSLLKHPLYVGGNVERRTWDPLPYPTEDGEFVFVYTSPEEAASIAGPMGELGIGFFPMPIEEIFEDLPPGAHLSINPFGSAEERLDIEADDFPRMRELLEEFRSSEAAG
ncbi:MAG: hypothetical protein JWO82_3408 [Akkermansiaceae bacterium]|nr:hypothetical protein [Akkermansiaceae bacterium]